MILFRLIVVLTLMFFVQVTLAQVSSVEGIKPLEGVMVSKANSMQSLAPGAVFKDCNDCPEMVMIPTGSFLMGSPLDDSDPFGEKKKINSEELPQHRVQIKAFAIGKYEINQEEYYSVMGKNPSYFKGRALPVEQVSWDDAQEFVKRLSTKTGKNYRLPSEAEWEYAARAGSTTEFSFGSAVGQLSDYAWYSDNAGGRTQNVGRKKPNAFGLYDIHGNVWEWTQGCWNSNYLDSPMDGSAWETGDCSQRVGRGGSWFNFATFLRSASRYRYPSNYRGYDFGIRIAINIE